MQKYARAIRLLPVILYISVIPLIVRAVPYTAPIGDLPWMYGEDDTIQWDFFNLAKLDVLEAVTVFAVVVFFFLLLTKRIRLKRSVIFIPVALYTAAVLLSFCLSDHRDIALRGELGHFEGLLCVLCYMFMLFYTIQVLESVDDALCVMGFLAVTVLIECIIGVSQLVGKDLLASRAGMYMIAGNREISFTFAPGQVYQTVANMNYVPLWLSLVVPVVILAAAVCAARLIRYPDTRTLKSREALIFLAAIILCILILLNCIGAKSMGGLLGIGISLALLAVLAIPGKALRRCMLAAVPFLAAVAVLLLYVRSPVDEVSVEYLRTGQDGIGISMAGQPMTIRSDMQGIITAFDESGGQVEAYTVREGDEAEYVFNKEGYWAGALLARSMGTGSDAYVQLDINHGEKYLFHFYDSGLVKLCTPYGYEIDAADTEHIGFKGHYGFASGRGYIWATSLPIIGHSPVLGAGPGTFMVTFPQTDYAGRATAGVPSTIIVDKAHNIYIQTAVNNGLAGLIAFTGIICTVCAMAFRSMANNGKRGPGKLAEMDVKSILLTGGALGVIGFATGAITCDSSISVMPVFYGMIGMVAAVSEADK